MPGTRLGARKLSANEIDKKTPHGAYILVMEGDKRIDSAMNTELGVRKTSTDKNEARKHEAGTSTLKGAVRKGLTEKVLFSAKT